MLPQALPELLGVVVAAAGEGGGWQACPAGFSWVALGRAAWGSPAAAAG